MHIFYTSYPAIQTLQKTLKKQIQNSHLFTFFHSKLLFFQLICQYVQQKFDIYILPNVASITQTDKLNYSRYQSKIHSSYEKRDNLLIERGSFF